jgi:hypothetical protein
MNTAKRMDWMKRVQFWVSASVAIELGSVAESLRVND